MSATVTPLRAAHLPSCHQPPAAASSAPQVPSRSSWRAQRPALARLCAGEVLLLTDDEVDLVDLVNRAKQVTPSLLDEQRGVAAKRLRHLERVLTPTPAPVSPPCAPATCGPPGC